MTETKQRLENWYKLFVQTYPTKINTETGFEYLYRYAPPDEILTLIFNWVKDYQEIKRSAGTNQFIRELPNLYTFFKTKRWKDPLPERKKERKTLYESPCDCGKPAFIHRQGPNSQSFCCECYVRNLAKWRKYLANAKGDWHLPQKRT